MVAMLTRHSKPSMPAPGGRHTISRVLPPPFFHGVGVRSARAKRWSMAAHHLIIGSFSPCFFAVAMACS